MGIPWLRPPVNKPTEDYKADQRGVQMEAAKEELQGRRKRRMSSRRMWAGRENNAQYIEGRKEEKWDIQERVTEKRG